MRKHLFLLPLLSFFVFIFLGCETEKSFIPAYIKVDSVSVDAYSIGGNNIQQITAFQLYQNQNFLGTYPIPSKIPVDGQGKNSYSFAPYVKLNGSSSQFSPYLSLQFFDTQITVERGNVVECTPKFKYRTSAKIIWQEDFEDASSTLVPVSVSKGDTTFMDDRKFDLNGRFYGNSRVFVAKFKQIDSVRKMDLASFTTFKNIPVDGTDVYLEFDIKTDMPVQIFIKRTSASKGTEFVPYLLVNPTKDNWKRFYVDLVYETQGQPTGTNYDLYFSFDKSATFEGNHEILFDNIRLSHASK